jgi:hypothetical protein
MPSLLRVAPSVVHMAAGTGEFAAVDKSKRGAGRKADIRSESTWEKSREITASLPQVADEGISLEFIELDNDDEKENTSKSSVISDSTNKANSSSNDGQEGVKELLTGMALPERSQSNADEPTYLPSLERLSEFRIDQASSIDDLEWIRRRLLLLLDRVNARLTEKRVKESLTQCPSGIFSSLNIDQIPMPDLMDRLNQDIDESLSSNGKRNHFDKSESAELNNDGRKRQRRPCPLCLEKTAVPSSAAAAAAVECEICEQSGLCHRCSSSCPSCHRTACADCLFSCSDCGLRYHCSDCVIFGGSKCIICKERPKTIQTGVVCSLEREEECIDDLNKEMKSVSSRLNQTAGVPHLNHPQTSLPIPQSRLTITDPTPSEKNSLLGVHSQKLPLPETDATSSQQALPTVAAIQTNPIPIPSQLYSIHRFVISDKGMIGINITSFYVSRQCIVSAVNPNSIASYHGVEVNDEIIAPKSMSEEKEYPNVYDLFTKAAKHRPLLFEVKRKYKSTSVSESLAIVGPHSCHRFIISETDSLGISIQRRCCRSTIVSAVEPNSLGDIYGFCENDIICEPFEKFYDLATGGERPWIVNVLRAVSTTTEGARRLPIQAGCFENPFIFSFPIHNMVADKTETKDKGVGNIRECDVVEEDNTEGNVNVSSEIIVIDDDDE